MHTGAEGRGGGGQMPPRCPKNSQVIYSTSSYLHMLGQSAFLQTYCTCIVY